MYKRILYRLNPKRISSFLFGNPDDLAFENRITYIISFISSIGCIFATLINLYLQLDSQLTLTTCIGFFVFFINYYIGRVLKFSILSKWILTIISYPFLSILWYYNQASLGPILFMYVVLYVFIVFFWERKAKNLFIILYFLNLISLFIFDYLYPTHSGMYYNDHTRIFDIYSSIIMVMVIVSFFLFNIKKDFISQREKAIQSDKLKSAFLANMSHEIRTPMNGIIGFTQLLKDAETEDEKDKYIHIIKENGEHLVQIIDDIIDISKIEAGYLDVNYSKFNLVDFFEDIHLLIEQFQQKYNKTHLELSYTPPKFCTHIISDKYRLKQVLINLLVNAVKFTEKGFIRYGCFQNNNIITIFIADSGIGIEKKHHKDVFERFRKIDFTNTKIYSGTGLGLSICKNIIELMKGRIYLQSEPSNGTTFYIELPVVDDSVLGKSDFYAEVIKPTSTKTVLVAEDDDINYLLIETLLKRNKIKSIRAIDGKEVLDIISRDKSINLVLMDIKMPRMNGYEALEKLRSFYPELPVIAQTANAMEEDRKRCMEAGFNDYISKPFSKEKFINTVLQHL